MTDAAAKLGEELYLGEVQRIRDDEGFAGIDVVILRVGNYQSNSQD